MRISYLPGPVRKQVEAAGAGATPSVILRAWNSLDNTSGETYLIALPEKLLLFSKSLGDRDYRALTIAWPAGVTRCELRKANYDTFLDLGADGRLFSLRASESELKDIQPLLDQWQAVPRSAPRDPSSTPGAGQPGLPADMAPMMAFATALLFAAAEDGEIDPLEELSIKSACGGDDELLGAALRYYNSHTIDDLLPLLGKLGKEQKLCVFANLLDILMSDGMLRTAEFALADKLAHAMGIQPADRAALDSALRIKNHTAVLAPARPRTSPDQAARPSR